MSHRVTVVGGGLAGCEAALQLSRGGCSVRLVEMRPVRSTEAHQTDRLGELVCTNSFKSEAPANAHGQLKREMRALGSVLLESADRARVAAGSALAVDRALFSDAMTEAVEGDAAIELVREECTDLPEGPAVVATGPLTSDALSEAIGELLGDGGLAFFDAIAPIVASRELWTTAWYSPPGASTRTPTISTARCPSRRVRGVRRELSAGRGYTRDTNWDAVPYFEGCLPVEVMATRGPDTLRFGPMKPIGLTDPRTGETPVGGRAAPSRGPRRADVEPGRVPDPAQASVSRPRVFRTDPWTRRGGVPALGLDPPQQLPELPRAAGAEYGAHPGRPDLVFAGQLTGVEGYTESAASGILAGINLARLLAGS